MNSTSQQLTRRSINAGLWLTTYRVFSKLVGLLKVSVLARILTPQQFGVFGIVSISLNLIETFSEIGIEEALIQRKQINDSQLMAGWLTIIARSLLITLIIFLSAPFFASFFQTPEVTLFIQATSIIPLVRSLRNPRLIYNKKNLQFKQEALMFMSGTVIEVTTALYLGFTYRNVWALAASIIAYAFAEAVTSYLILPLPKFVRPDFSLIPKLVSFGRWVWLSSSLKYLVNQGDDIIVGKLVGTAPLGLYQNAFKIASLPATEITSTLTQVTFPAFASIQHDRSRLVRAFKKTLALNILINLPLIILITLFAQPLTLIIYGSQWLGLIPVLKILTLFGALRAFFTSFEAILVALGKPKTIAISNLIRFASLFILLLPLTNNFGIIGAAWSTVIAILISSVFLSIVTVIHLKSSPQIDNH